MKIPVPEHEFSGLGSFEIERQVMFLHKTHPTDHLVAKGHQLTKESLTHALHMAASFPNESPTLILHAARSVMNPMVSE